jgi:hypothetical protein
LAAVLAPLVKGPRRLITVRDTATYAVSGTVASVGVGLALGAFGTLVLPREVERLGPWFGLALALLALAREIGNVPVPLPQLRRVSDRRWGMWFPSGVAAALWGLDIGLFATTRVSLLGAWIVPVVAVCSRDPVIGANVFGAYWFGRLASTVITPRLVPHGDAVELLAQIDAKRSVFQLTYVLGLVWAAAVFVLFVAR